MPGSVGDSRASRQGDAQREGYDVMLMRRTIGISLACLVTSVCAIGRTPQERGRDPRPSPNFPPFAILQAPMVRV